MIRPHFLSDEFLLTKAKPPKGGDAKPWAFDRVGPAIQVGRSMVARLPKGWAGDEPVRPRVLAPMMGKRKGLYDSGAGSPATRRLALAF